jgi:hypothetical protein
MSTLTKIQIKHRWTEAVLFECDVPANVASGMAMRWALEKATTERVDLRGANLSGADLRGAELDDVQLLMYRDDIWAVLSSAPHEAAAVLAALRSGRADGSTYSGECACLVGTIAQARACNYMALGALKPNSSRYAEQWFMQIRPSQTPENHKPAALAAKWVSEWIDAMTAAFGPKEVA